MNGEGIVDGTRHSESFSSSFHHHKRVWRGTRNFIFNQVIEPQPILINMIILGKNFLHHSSHSITIRTFHSNVIPLSFRCRSITRDMTKFWWWNDPETKLSLVLGSFYFRTMRNKKRPRSKERQERSWNDPNCSGNEDQTVAKEGRTIQDVQSFRFSFLSFGPRSSF